MTDRLDELRQQTQDAARRARELQQELSRAETDERREGGAVVVKRLALIVSGDRNGSATPASRAAWQVALVPVLRELREAYDDVVLLHGACGCDSDGTGEMKGVDLLADQWGRHLGFDVRPMPAPWHKTGKAAGPFRNGAMDTAQEAFGACGYDELTICCHNWLQGSKGTKGMYDLSRRRGVAVRVLTSGEG